MAQGSSPSADPSKKGASQWSTASNASTDGSASGSDHSRSKGLTYPIDRYQSSTDDPWHVGQPAKSALDKQREAEAIARKAGAERK